MKLFAFLFLVITYFFSSDFVEEKIPWTENYKLTWADFKAPSRTRAGFVASTSSGLAYSYTYSNSDKRGKMNTKVVVSCNFYPKKSWYRVKDTSNYILKHEQTHFDISELHARKLRKQIEETNFSEDMGSELENLFYKIDDERKLMQQKFDKESNHSIIKEKEYQWEDFVAQQLKFYEHWK